MVKPGPGSPGSAAFWDACQRGELWFQRCSRCGAAQFPPAAHCRFCLADEPGWERSAGRGTLYSWTVVWRPPQPAWQAPYAVAIVDVEEGYQMVANVVGCRAEDLRIGLALQVEFSDTPGGGSLPWFRPAEPALP